MEAVLLKGKAAKHIKKNTTRHIRIPVFSKNKIKNVSCTSCLAFPFKNTCMYIFIPYNMYDEEWNCSRLRFNPARGKRWQMDFRPLTKLRAFFFFWGGVYRRAKRPVITINSNQIFLFWNNPATRLWFCSGSSLCNSNVNSNNSNNLLFYAPL